MSNAPQNLGRHPTTPDNNQRLHTDAAGSTPETTSEADIRRYRVNRRKTASRSYPRKSEEENIIDFVKRWQPYGGPPPDEIFVSFGMTPARFIDKLRKILPEYPASP
ncbi:hypothetical protein P3H15_47995 [Rhodococcus sp. T2V]|uniref:hypothetical protein n=1 Tax=Rhodococcus sp. T2V TaxID=3034164 RepID=UPI0023E0E0EA|nr:hypothetical protein [Rhodococcus sp. T2V]MDF3312691.1 hypothetical protein [Rhodococcus sp. T2V]